MQVDSSDRVRRYLAELMEEAAAAAPQPAVLQPAASCLTALVGDANVGVAKRAVPAAATVLRTSFAIAAAQAHPSPRALYICCPVRIPCLSAVEGGPLQLSAAQLSLQSAQLSRAPPQS